MARITIEDCLEKVPSRFQLVHMAAKRVRQIREGSEYLVNSPKNEDIVVALREIAAEKVRVKSAEAQAEAEVEVDAEAEVVAEPAETAEAPEAEAGEESPESEETAEPAE